MSLFPKKSLLVLSPRLLVVFLLVGFFVSYATTLAQTSYTDDLLNVNGGGGVDTNTILPTGLPNTTIDAITTGGGTPEERAAAVGLDTPSPTTGNLAGDAQNPGAVGHDTSGIKVNCPTDGWLSWLTDSVACQLPAGIAMAVINVELVILNIIAAFMQWCIQYPLLKLSAVVVAWQFLRDLVNICFVLAMILMSFATMLNIVQYAYRNLLFKVIVGALLINFSLVFVGFFLDLNSISSTFMLNQMGTEQGLADLIINSANITAIAGNDTGGVPLLAVMGMPFFMLIIILVFLSILIPMIVRIVYLIQYVVTSPLIWLQYIFVEAEWKKWWQGFFAWCFMPTITLFFLYLAFAIYSPMAAAIAESQNKGAVGDTLVNMAITAVILGTLLMSAVAAAWKGMDKLAQMAIMLASGIGGMVGKQLLGVVARTGLGAMAKKEGGKLAQKGLGMQGGPLGIKGLAGNVLTRAGQVGQRAGEKLEEPSRKEEQERIKLMNEDTLKKNAEEALKNPAGKLDANNKIKQQEAIKAALEKGLLNNANEAQLNGIVKSFESEGNLDARRQLMQDFIKNADKFTNTDALNKLVQSRDALKTTKIDSTTGKEIVTEDTEAKMKLAASLAKRKKLETTTLDTMGLNDATINNALKTKHAEEYKTITGANIAYDHSVVSATTPAEQAKAITTILSNASPEEAAQIDMPNLMYTKTGGVDLDRIRALRDSDNSHALKQVFRQKPEHSTKMLAELSAEILRESGGAVSHHTWLKKNRPRMYKYVKSNAHHIERLKDATTDAREKRVLNELLS